MKQIKEELGYTCTVCDFNFKEKYGELGKFFIELQHIIPYAELEKNEKREVTKKDFLSFVQTVIV